MTTTSDIMRPFHADVEASISRLAPERADELKQRLDQAKFEGLQFVDGYGRFVAMPGLDPHIRVSGAGLASLWALSYVAYSFMDIGTRFAASEEGKSIDQLVVWAHPSYAELINFSRRLFDADEAWPDLPTPVNDATDGSLDACVNNLFLATTGWILLHEVAHMTMGHSSNVEPVNARKQEEEADEFAVDWLLEKCPRPEQREFRVLAMIVAVGWLFLHEETRRGPGGHHPQAIVRYWQAISKFNVPSESPALECGAYFLKAVFDPTSDQMPVDVNAGEAFDWMGRRLLQLFPRR